MLPVLGRDEDGLRAVNHYAKKLSLVTPKSRTRQPRPGFAANIAPIHLRLPSQGV